MTIELEQKQIPVLLLTGYLGSGKTTLLNRILSNRKGIKFAVIVNDIGEVNIDADLIEKGGIVGQTDDSLVALQNGCICCTLKMDLVAQLAEISAMRKFDYIVIEASGICEPAPIAQTISTLPAFGPQYVHEALPYLDCIVTVVDALRMKDEFENGGALQKEDIGEDDLERLVIEQIEFCNIVLLNKASEITPDEMGKLKGIVSSINPQAKILECNYGDIDLDEIIYTGMFDFDRVATSAAWIAAIEGEDEEEEAEGEALATLTSATSSSRPDARRASAMRASGTPPWKRRNWKSACSAIRSSAATGIRSMATACRRSSSSASTWTRKDSRN